MLAAGEDFLRVEKTTGEDGNPDLLITMDRSKIATVGAPAISKFLVELQVYKSTGDVKGARKMYDTARYLEKGRNLGCSGGILLLQGRNPGLFLFWVTQCLRIKL